MDIIRAERDQYEAVRAFYHSMIDAMAGGPAYVGWKKDIYPSPALLAGSVSRGELYLALADGRIVAAMILNHSCNDGYARCRWGVSADDSEVMVIHALGVHPDHQRKGCARSLVRKAIDTARESGMKAVRLDVLEGNLPAERLYSGLGFHFRETQQMYYEDTGWTSFRLYEYVI